MTDDDGAFDAETIEHVAQHRRLIGRRTAAPAFAFAPAEAGAIDQDDAVPRGKTLAERQPHVFEIAAGAVEKNDRQTGSAAKLDHMLAQAADVDEAAARRMRPLDQPRPDESNDCAGGKDFGNGGQRVHQVWMVSPLSQRAPCA